MATVHESDHQKRLAAFGVSPADIEVLERHADAVTRRLPELLEQLHGRFAGWPDIHSALMEPEVHRLRLHHWTLVATGRFGEGFHDSADALARAFHAHGVPGYAVVICHAVVADGIVGCLGPDKPARRRWFHGTGRKAAETGFPSALRRVASLDLELLLETYAAVERDRRETAGAEVETFESSMRLVAAAVGAGVAGVGESARAMADAVERTRSQTESVSAVSDQASANVQTVAGAAEELSASIGEVSAQVSKAAAIARQGNEAAQRTDTTVQGLAASAQKIGDVVSLISSIAGQTNLLALNATIEAARAGEAGKGFAVVASEVKSLASQTAKATEEISAQIASMQNVTRETVEALRGIGQVIAEMDRVAAAIAAAVEQQRAATQEIAGNVHQVAAGTRDVTSSIATVADTARAAGEAATRVLGTAGDLSGQAGKLQAAVSGFVERMRAA